MEHTKPQPLKSPQLYSYAAGFVLSIICTAVVYWFVDRHIANGNPDSSRRLLIAFIMAFAMVQLVVQLVFFLHLGREHKPKWNMYALLFTGLIVTILVAGTLWIMANLNYNMMPEQQDTYIIKDEGVHN